MQTTDVTTLELEPHHPVILSSSDAARVVVLALPEGEEMQTHEVHERAFLVITWGRLEIQAGEETVTGGTGMVAEFEPQESHRVKALEDSRFLLFLVPWPGAGHPGAMTIEEKGNARERAREHR